MAQLPHFIAKIFGTPCTPNYIQSKYLQRANDINLLQARWRWMALFEKEKVFIWYIWDDESKKWLETELLASSSSIACSKARRWWSEQYFRLVSCGVLFTLPERDEVGSPATFFHLHASMQNPNGIFMNNSLGHSCRVDQISHEALEFWQLTKTKAINLEF